jgi:hypothetical protein
VHSVSAPNSVFFFLSDSRGAPVFPCRLTEAEDYFEDALDLVKDLPMVGLSAVLRFMGRLPGYHDCLLPGVLMDADPETGMGVDNGEPGPHIPQTWVRQTDHGRMACLLPNGLVRPVCLT